MSGLAEWLVLLLFGDGDWETLLEDKEFSS